MAKILGNYLRAREGAYFKLEQEASVQQLKEKLIKEGKIKPADPSSPENLHPSPSLHDSENVYEVLPEVLQAQVRVDDPNAAKRREYEIRIKGEPPPPTEDELRRYRVSSGALSAAVGHVPRLSLSGRHRYGIPSYESASGGGELALRASTMSPEAVEVARRSYVAGVRALTYGSLLGFGLLAAGGTFAVHYFEVGAGEQSVRERVRTALEPMSQGLRTRIQPWKEMAAAWVGNTSDSSAGGAQNSGGSMSGLQSRLKERYNPNSPNAVSIVR